MKVELRDSLEFLYADSTVAKQPCRSVTVDTAQDSIASVHLLINGVHTGDRVRFTVRKGNRIVDNARWFRLVDVPVEVNTGTVGFVEKKGEKNPFVAKRAPFRVFDAMEPVNNSTRAESAIMALRLHIPIVRRGGRTRTEYTISIMCGKESHELSLRVNTYGVKVPVVGDASFPYTNWFSFDMMADRHGLKKWSREHWRMIRKYAELMAHARQNVFWIPLGTVFEKKAGRLVLNRSRLRRIVKVFSDAGMHYIEGGHVAHRTGGEWQAETFDMVLSNSRATSSNGNADLACIAGQLMEEIDKNQWRDRWIQHVTDEPIAANATDYRILVGMTRRHMPGIPILDATMDPKLVGSVNIWCPQAQEYQKHRKEFDAQRSCGDSIWFYTCCFPGGPWLNRLLDMELLRPTLLGWGAALFNLEGFLHWGLNHYGRKQDPFQQSVIKHGNTNSLPAGDTHVVYPGRGAPWSSLRLEAQREGLEDYELLRRVRERNPKIALPIIRKAIRGFDRYTRDVKKFRLARKALLVAAERTQGGRGPQSVGRRTCSLSVNVCAITRPGRSQITNRK